MHKHNSQHAELKYLLKSGIPLLHLKIGECIFTDKPVLITTVLGSCVSVTFHHPKTRTSAVFHAMLPESGVEKTPHYDPCKYVDSAMRTLLNRFQARGIKPCDLVVKLFGGAFSVKADAKHQIREIVDVGAKNVAVAERVAAEYGLDYTVRNTKGPRGRKLYYHTADGSVWMKYLKEMNFSVEMQIISKAKAELEKR